MNTDANQKTKKRRDQEKRKPEEILKNSTQQQPLFSLKDTPLAYYSVVTVLKEREDRLVLRMKADREMFPEYLVLKWEKAGGRLEREYGLLSAFYDHNRKQYCCQCCINCHILDVLLIQGYGSHKIYCHQSRQ